MANELYARTTICGLKEQLRIVAGAQGGYAKISLSKEQDFSAEDC
jgi:hypothetical protein